jgi:hypothetical protein
MLARPAGDADRHGPPADDLSVAPSDVENRARGAYRGTIAMTDEMEEVLLSRRPEPRPDFVETLEADLMRRARRPRSGRMVQGFAVAAALAVTVVLLGLTGGLPLRLGADRPATATQRCSTVFVERAERRPVFVVSRSGDLRVTYRTRLVRHPVRRCR